MPEAAANQQWSETKRSVPAAAMRFSLGVFEFGDVQTDSAGKKTIPVTLLARSGKPIQHWYWGSVVHDFAGMKRHKDELPIDYCHDSREVLGFLDKFDTSSGDLKTSGALVPFDEKDRANEIAFKSKNKVPYEASINFSGGPLRLEELEVGTSATVNGNVVNGPALVIREWPLRGVAICLYGADMGTSTEFSAGGNGNDKRESIEVTLFSNRGNSMPAANTPEGKITETNKQQLQQQPPAGDAKPGETPTPAADPTKLGESAKPGETPAPATATPKPGQEYIDAFGADGALWFHQGKPFAACVTEFCGSQKTRIGELEAQVKQLQQQIKDMPAGNEAASFQSEKKPGEAATGGDGRSKFMASIKASRTKNTTK